MIQTIVFLLIAAPLLVSPHCNTYGPCRSPLYLPAPPGHVPPCAKPGWTYCENIDHYPNELIRYLIDHWGYNYHKLISDESTQTFNYREPVTYGPPISHGYYPSSNGTIGYPPRRYKLPAHQQHLLDEPAGYLTYSSLHQQRPPVTHYNPNQWWTRYRRSIDGHKRRRRRRQAAPSPSSSPADTITLCPTTRQFIMPKAAMNNQGNWMYVVNLSESDNRYTQLVGTEICTSSQCNGLCSLPDGYSSRCEQQYVQKRLIALEGAGNRLYTDVFWFPHCCICQITPAATG